MAVRVAINGFGRIGRNVLRAAAEERRASFEQQEASLSERRTHRSRLNQRVQDALESKLPDSIGFLAVAWMFGLVSSWWALMAIPAALIVGFAFASAGMAATSCPTRKASLPAGLLPLTLRSQSSSRCCQPSTRLRPPHSSVRRSISNLMARLLVAAHETRQLPAATFLAEAKLIAAERAQRLGWHEARFA